MEQWDNRRSVQLHFVRSGLAGQLIKCILSNRHKSFSNYPNIGSNNLTEYSNQMFFGRWTLLLSSTRNITLERNSWTDFQQNRTWKKYNLKVRLFWRNITIKLFGRNITYFAEISLLNFSDEISRISTKCHWKIFRMKYHSEWLDEYR